MPIDMHKGIDLEEITKEIKNIPCLVFGDIMLDRYIYGEVGRISPEAPIPVVNVVEVKENLGGAANVAANIKSLGCITYLCGVIGTDTIGGTICNLLKNRNISFCGLSIEKRPTTSKNRIIGKGQQIVRFDEEVCVPLKQQEENSLCTRIASIMEDIKLVVISDYAKGTCTPDLCRAIISEAYSRHIKVIIDPKGVDWEKYSRAYIITPNWKEFTEIVGLVNVEDDMEIKRKALMLLEKYQLENILITRSEHGMTLISRNLYLNFSAEAREVSDVSGAGDTAIAALAVFLSANMQLEKAVYWANRAAGLAVECVGTSIIGMEELFHECRNVFIQMNFIHKIKTLVQLKEQLVLLRKQYCKIVFTNGCFDILHMGHIKYLNEAKKLGDFLIVAVNTDQSVKRLNKGENRPINNETDRAMQLAALQMVDAVILFDEDTPLELLRHICPDILVKGGDYKLEEIVGREYAGETKVLSLVEGYSTTQLIEKIRCGK